MEKIDAAKLKYTILPGPHIHGGQRLPIYEDSYLLWRNFWEETYLSLDCLEKFSRDDFYRQSYIGVLTFNRQIAGMLLSSVFDLRSQSGAEHRYLSIYQDDFIRELKNRNLYLIQTVEYLTVPEKWRSKITGLQLSDVLIGLATEIFKKSHYDAIIGAARLDYKVHEKCFQFGFETVIGNVKRRNFPLDLIAVSKSSVKDSNNDVTNNLVKTLWKNRTDYTNYTYNNDQLRSAA